MLIRNVLVNNGVSVRLAVWAGVRTIGSGVNPISLFSSRFPFLHRERHPTRIQNPSRLCKTKAIVSSIFFLLFLQWPGVTRASDTLPLFLSGLKLFRAVFNFART